ncbi:hypothetical protein H634G_03640 [Metarhizium anisopliae BRIP 53293]|uniref:Uncharacterized protein n=1 Tax=Metarhizium anisopliae BRIP 53293 TaxID=1291518 RepID=A0A0D9P4U7_METAN|nr:hypothetical protein H634G_03640 [Metarhizium anisopliae BRIP 53293]KJK95330.1 hypothetical protein H633G_00839 [Metarhizium anisopliae BRIP 53284]
MDLEIWRATMRHRQAHFTQDGKWTKNPTNLVYVRTFDGWQGRYCTHVTCIAREEERRRDKEEQKEKPRLQKIVPKNGQPTGPSPGFYKADKPPYTNCPTPSFFYIDLNPQAEKDPVHHVKDIGDLSYKYLVQLARDTQVDIVDLDLVETSPENNLGTIGLDKTNEDQDGTQRAWQFLPGEIALEWPHTTPFHGAFLGRG